MAVQPNQRGAATIPPPLPGAPEQPGRLNSKYLRLNELRWLRDLFFASRRVVEGQYAGRHSSSQRGHSVEFSDYRPYMPGDEPTDVDWKIYGRSDRLYVKLFEQQSDMTVNLVVDGSAHAVVADEAVGTSGPLLAITHRPHDTLIALADEVAWTVAVLGNVHAVDGGVFGHIETDVYRRIRLGVGNVITR